ncbi:glucose 1-dehydrogenase [Chloroflexota bacterium]
MMAGPGGYISRAEGLIGEKQKEVTMREGLVEGKVALVTGAGSGIGQASALKFAREGANVVIADVSAEGGEETLQMLRKAGGEGIFIQTDVSKKEDVEAMVKKAVETYGRLDCAHNNAGIGGEWGRMADTSEENWDRIMGINLKGIWYCMRAEIHQMVKQGGGAIVNTASAGGLATSKFTADYTTSKHGVVGLTRAAAVDYAVRGIRVNCVCPGIVNTPLSAPLQAMPDMAAKFASMQPLNRFAEPGEIANAAVWLCSDEASFVNGHALAVDGGMTIEIMILPPEITDIIP